MPGLRSRRKKAHQGRPDVIVGKAGFSENVLREIDRQLEEKEVIKVKMLKSTLKVEELDRRSLARKVAERLGASLLGVRGRTFILYRPRGRKAIKRDVPNQGEASKGGA